jgi:hypothetical protein
MSELHKCAELETRCFNMGGFLWYGREGGFFSPYKDG